MMELFHALEEVHSPETFKACMDHQMQAVLPHGMVLCSIGRLVAGGVEACQLLTYRYPLQYLETLRGPNGILRSPVIERWKATHRPVLVEFEHDINSWPNNWVQTARKYDFKNLASHSFFDMTGELYSNFCFAQIPERLGEKHDQLMRLLVPHLHLALVRAMPPDPVRVRRAAASLITERQRTILYWAQFGKTNADIAAILDMSEANVKYHLKAVFRALNVSNRAQAVARALELKLVDAATAVSGT
ncbi:MAG TPA: helix-turn-helix transcriptional regulator [Ideonella sp.]|uniref:response regulator transcription factor n=1 Tax=Ideonella sp. TaxID=1929293 RepID=UPI002E310120|nr:helix-turn-helix transcriptional regulator [Ideonella sp.]HEX5682770.1 helix-turn-helix transcriptional regulator [Ideonella sp.]